MEKHWIQYTFNNIYIVDIFRKKHTELWKCNTLLSMWTYDIQTPLVPPLSGATVSLSLHCCVWKCSLLNFLPLPASHIALFVYFWTVDSRIVSRSVQIVFLVYTTVLSMFFIKNMLNRKHFEEFYYNLASTILVLTLIN